MMVLVIGGLAAGADTMIRTVCGTTSGRLRVALLFGEYNFCGLFGYHCSLAPDPGRQCASSFAPRGVFARGTRPTTPGNRPSGPSVAIRRALSVPTRTVHRGTHFRLRANPARGLLPHRSVFCFVLTVLPCLVMTRSPYPTFTRRRSRLSPRPCDRRGRYAVTKLLEEHGDAKLTDLPVTLADRPKSAGQHPRPMQGGHRTACGSLSAARLKALRAPARATAM